MALKEVTTCFMQAASLFIVLSEHMSIRGFVTLMSGVFDRYPTLTPDRFDPFDPLRTKYTKETFQQLIHNEDAERHLMWRGKKLAHFMHRMASPDKGDTWIFDYDRRIIGDDVIHSAADMMAIAPVEIATLHIMSKEEMRHCKSIGAGWEQGEGYSFRSLFRDQRAFGLPTLAWRNYFGPMYIRHFGRDRLMSAPAWSVREVHPNVISVQLTESIDSVGTEWDRFHEVRQRVIAHLGAESFQRPRESPDDPPPMGELDRRGVPGTAVPQELIPLRRSIEADHEKERRPKPLAVESLEEMLAEPQRFRVFQIKAGKKKDKVIVDTLREEMIGLADPIMREEWVEKLLAAGAEFKDMT